MHLFHHSSWVYEVFQGILAYDQIHSSIPERQSMRITDQRRFPIPQMLDVEVDIMVASFLQRLAEHVLAAPRSSTVPVPGEMASRMRWASLLMPISIVGAMKRPLHTGLPGK